ncbi:hypothetical protein [Methanoculleus sp. 7T]|jgi:uncharacterized membrane protein YciS (DUF1049 family)|uniref:hypothetical protein n=1 Tax=Methanoculleus sp. 7T TaxID=2937282 RepID=UPI0020C06981|nr:hypothetical protein [Methanoculleus sp. 7T]MCK8519737.1 hypothetical protein [Methanoculleus sp. 7T]
MEQDRWKLYLKALWGAVIALLVISLIIGAVAGSDSWNFMLAGSVHVVTLLAVLTLLLIIIVRLKEWVEAQVANVANRKGGEQEALQQSLKRIEAKVDRIEKILAEVSE